MKEEAATDAPLRQFLLGKVDDEERQRIESRFLTDSEMRDSLIAAEQKLLDDYLEGCLSPADREAFLSFYGDTAEQRRKLRIAESIQQWAVDQPKTQPVTPEPATSMWSRLRARLQLKPVLVIPIAVTATVVIVVAVLWVNSRTAERQRQYLAVQQELVDLNSHSRRSEVPPQGLLLTLKPGSVRTVEPEPELKRRPDSSVAELRLLWMQEEDYPTYQAVVRPLRDDTSYTIPNLTAENENGKIVRVRLLVHRLTRGNYRIELTGVSADGSKSPAEIYSFTVSE